MHDRDEARLLQDDPSWASRVRAGDVRALEQAFRAYYSSMCSFVCVQVGSAETAEDLVQDVFLRIWQTRHRLDANGSLRNLLYRSAHNAAINHLKHRAIEARWQHARQSDAEATSSYHDPASYREVSTAVDHALSVLPERCRLIFTMSRQHGLSYSEIADTLGVSVKTVETQMGRALKSLRAQLSTHLTL